MFSLSHGTNDAQKTMGIIALGLVANGNLAPGADPPTWVIVSSATVIAAGTYVGGWRIIRTMGTRIIKMDPAQGFAAQSVGAAVILSASHVGFPLSTTQVISGGIMGAGAAKRISAVRWGVAGNIVVAWVLTLPASAIMGGVTYGVTRLFGTGAAGPVVVSAALLALLAWVFGRRLVAGRTLTAEG
jgi:PiT family inorganic phosphate transporter